MRRARRPRAPRSRAAGGHWVTTTAAVGGGDLAQAAEEIARAARENASWSSKVPASIRVEKVDEDTVNIVADAPAAYPGETRASHPLFATGPRSDWVWRSKAGQPFRAPGRAFLRPAADARADAAAAKYAEKLDRIAQGRGFKPQ